MQNATLQIGVKKFLWLKKVKNSVPEIVETFYKKELQKINQKEFTVVKVI